MQLNENQREGLAKVADNLATAVMIASIAGGFLKHDIGYRTVTALFVIFFVLLYIAVNLRGKENSNGN